MQKATSVPPNKISFKLRVILVAGLTNADKDKTYFGVYTHQCNLHSDWKEAFIKKPFLFPEQQDFQATTSRTSVGSLHCPPH